MRSEYSLTYKQLRPVMPPQVTFTASVLSLLARLQVDIGQLDIAGQFEVVMLCEQRLADKRTSLSTRDVMALLGCKSPSGNILNCRNHL